MRKLTADALFDELEKIAIDPVSAAGLMAAGKIMTTNALARHGMKLAPIRRIAQEVMGAGFRSGQAGRPMLSRLTRESLAIGLDPNTVRLYEMGHGLGGAGVTQGHMNLVKSLGRDPRMSHLLPKDLASFAAGVPTQANTPFRKALDYGLKPVGEVGQDIKGLGTRISSMVKSRVTGPPPSVPGKVAG